MIVTPYSGTHLMTWRPVGRRYWDAVLIAQRRERRIIQIEIAVTPSSGVCATPGRSVMRLR